MARFQYGSLVFQVSSTVTSGGTTTLVNTSRTVQVFTGSSAHTAKLPDATTMSNGQVFELYNTTTASALTIQYNDASTFSTLTAGNSLILRLIDNSTSNGTWAVLSTAAAGGIYSVVTTQTIAGGGTVTLTTAAAQYIPVAGSGGAVTLSTTPFASNPSDGTQITLEGTSNTNTVSLTNNDANGGVILNGDVTLGQYDTITLVYRQSLLRFVETGRNL